MGLTLERRDLQTSLNNLTQDYSSFDRCKPWLPGEGMVFFCLLGTDFVRPCAIKVCHRIIASEFIHSEERQGQAAHQLCASRIQLTDCAGYHSSSPVW
jgi:hypothetical protein